ncbi:MAG: hypothetical protein IJI21_01165 [Clostridia bacterium]|nr:hypothetical protein [Clostridia bacterium]
MRVTAILLILLCLAALVGTGFLYMNSRLVIESAGCIATDAVNEPETFERLRKEAMTETLVGTLFASPAEATPENSLFYSYTLKIENRTFLKAEIIEISITPMSGDYLQTGETQAYDLAPGRSMNLSATILSAKGGHNVREATVTWYFWGIPFKTRVTCK